MATKLFIPQKLQPWIEARQKFHLNHAQVQMTRELGMNPKKLGRIDNHKQERWKLPLPLYIEKLYAKRYGKKQPADVRPLETRLAEKAAKNAAKKFANASTPPSDSTAQHLTVEGSSLIVLLMMLLVLPAWGADIGKPDVSKGESINPQLVERWDAMYRGERRPGWDTGRPSSELKRFVEQKSLRPCRVVELGCGTGINAIYLASQGFDVTAIDVAPTALKTAAEAAAKAAVTVRWIQADVLNLPPLGEFDLVFDRGCYHAVRRQNAAGYVKTVSALCRPGGRALILAGNANEPNPTGPPRVDETELVADFAATFDFEQLREIRFDTAKGDAQGAWAWSVLLRRKAP